MSNPEPCGHVYEGSDPGIICDSCGRIHKAAEWWAGVLEEMGGPPTETGL